MVYSPSSIIAKNASGSKMNILGTVKLNCSIGSIAMGLLDFLIVSDLDTQGDCIIGNNTLLLCDVDIRSRMRALQQGDCIVYSCANESASPTPPPPVDISTDLTPPSLAPRVATVNLIVGYEQSIAPGETCTLLLQIPTATQGSDCVVDENTNKVKRLSLSSTWDTVREGRQVIASGTNTSAHRLLLKKGTLVGTASVYVQGIQEVEAPEITSLVAAVQSSPPSTTSAVLRPLLQATDFPHKDASLLDILAQHRDAIALPGEPPGLTNKIHHQINLLPHTSHIYTPAYRLPHSKREAVESSIAEMIRQGIVRSSNSPWNSPLFLIPKRGGTLRPVVDFRKLNAVTVPDRLPMPVMGDVLQSLGQGNIVFTTLDLKSAFWQIPLAEDSKPMTAFSTLTGHYEFNRMPFGLRNAPSTLQRLMYSIFHDQIGKDLFVYLDDLIVFSKDLDSHLATLNKVLDTLAKAGLKIEINKCSFLKCNISFLGHSIDRDGLHMLRDKVKAVQDFPTPRNPDNVRSFLGLASFYRNFIRNFAKRAAPLTKLTRHGTEFVWGTQEETCFQDLKHALTSYPILTFPNYTKPFHLTTDASTSGLGAVLQQEDDSGRKRVIAFASRAVSPAESNYSVTELEALSVVWALKHYKYMILGYEIHVHTDHKPLLGFLQDRHLQGKLSRWCLTIQEFNPTLHYIQGKDNRVADSLSRNVPTHSVTAAVVTPDAPLLPTYSPQDLQAEQRNDPVWSIILQRLQSGTPIRPSQSPVPIDELFIEHDILHRKTPSGNIQMIIPQSLVPPTLHLVHNAPIAGHPGRDKTLTEARRKFYWQTMSSDVTRHVALCPTCAQFRGSAAGQQPMLEVPLPAEPWDTIGIDLLKLPKSLNGSEYLLVTVDLFSRYSILTPLKDKTAESVARALVDSVFCTFNVPRRIVSDNGTEFKNELMEKIEQIYGIDRCYTTAFHPQGNGLVERTNRKILEILRPLVQEMKETWEYFIPMVRASLNGSLNSSTSKTPHYTVFGDDLRLPYHILTEPPKPLYTLDDYALSHIHAFHKIHTQVRQHLTASRSEIMAKQHKRCRELNLVTGDVVMRQLCFRSNKLDPKFEGPFVVVEKLPFNKYKLIDPSTDSPLVLHAERLKKIKSDIDANVILRRTGLLPQPASTTPNSQPATSTPTTSSPPQTTSNPPPSPPRDPSQFHMTLRPRRR